VGAPPVHVADEGRGVDGGADFRLPQEVQVHGALLVAHGLLLPATTPGEVRGKRMQVTHWLHTHSLTHSLMHSLTHSLIHSLTHSLTHSLISLTRSLTPTHSLIHSRTRSLPPSSRASSLVHTQPLTHTNTHSPPSL